MSNKWFDKMTIKFVSKEEQEIVHEKIKESWDKLGFVNETCSLDKIMIKKIKRNNK